MKIENQSLYKQYTVFYTCVASGQKKFTESDLFTICFVSFSSVVKTGLFHI